MLRFLKSKKGSSVVETIIMVPLWLIVFLFLVYANTVSKTRLELSEHTEVIAEIVAQSDTLQECYADILTYIKLDSSTMKLFNISSDAEDEESNYAASDVVKLYTTDNTLITTSNQFSNADYVIVSVTAYTSYLGLNFNSITINGNSLNFFATSFTNKVLVRMR